jgi:hypothetical protein
MMNGLQHVYEKWVERCKKCVTASLAKGGTSKKRPSTHLHKVPSRSNKVSPRTFQTALVYEVKSAVMPIEASMSEEGKKKQM